MLSIDDLARIAVFVKVVELGGFSQAARDIGATKSTVSKQVAELEARLGIKLLHRSTRQIGTTDAGKILYQRCRDLLSRAEDAGRAVLELQTEPRGTLRLACPSAFGRQYVIPVLTRFLTMWPHVNAELIDAGADIDLIAERIDVAIHLAPLAESTLIVRRLGESRRCLCASPEYLARHKMPETPADLQEHDCLVLGRPTPRPTWLLCGAEGPMEVPVRARVFAEKNEDLNEMMRAGLGIGYPPEFAAAGDLRAGRLLPVLEPFCRATMPIFLVCPPGRNDDPKVRRFIELVVQELGDGAPWSLRRS